MLRPARFAPADLALALCAVLGLLLLAGRLPAEHPTVAGDYSLGPEGAIEAAEAFMAGHGYTTDGLEPAAYFLAHPGVLNGVQETVGRRGTAEALAAEPAVPGFYWLVRWEATGGDQPGAERYAVRLSQDGTPWYFRNRGTMPLDGLDRAVLDRALGPAEQASAATGPDSVLAALLRFDLPPEGVAGSALADSMLQEDRRRRQAAEALAQPQRLSPVAAVALARAHLGPTLLERWPLEAVRVGPSPEAGRSARVLLQAAEPRLGRRLVAEVEVAAGGALLSLRTRFDVDTNGFVDDPSADGELASSLSVELFADPVLTAKVLVWVGIAVLIVVFFVRRLRVRALDTQAALVDGLVAGLLAGLSNLLLAPIYTHGAEVGEMILVLVINSLFWAGGVGLLAFVASATADSLARATWTEKIETLTLTRHGAWVNRPVGLALVRGVALAFALAGAMVGLLLLLPGVPLSYRGHMPLFGVQFSLSEILVVLAQQGWTAILWVQAVLLGLGSVLRRGVPGWGVVLGLTAVLALLGAAPLEPMVRAMPWVWGFSAVFGVGLALAFVRFDALTAGIGLLGSGMLAAVQDSWLIAASPSGFTVLLVLAFLAFLLGIGLVGIRRGDPDAAPYVPAYLIEIAERERLMHEVDIAREVQQSFLPKQMPEVEGLDFAAACLAAQDVGGDYYDVARLDERRVGIVVGDVSGKGIHAAFYMTLVKGFVQGIWTETAQPSELLRRLNRFFCASAPRGMFISVLCGVFDLEAGTFTFARAGHNPLLYKPAGATAAQMLQPPGLAVGLATGPRFDDTLVDQTLALAPGDLLVLYTDGVSEAMDRNRRLYGDYRLLRLLGEQNKKYAWALLGALVADVRAFAGGEDLHDDMTMVIVRVTEAHIAADRSAPTPPAPAPLPTSS